MRLLAALVAISSCFALSSCREVNAIELSRKLQSDINSNDPRLQESIHKDLETLTRGEDLPARIHALAAHGYMAIKNTESASKQIEIAMTKDGQDREVLLSAGQIYFQLGKYDEAITALSTAIRSNPDDANALRTLICAEWQKAGQDPASFGQKSLGLRLMMNRKEMRDDVNFYNLAVVATYNTDRKPGLMMPFLAMAERKDPTNAVTLLNNAVIADTVFKSKPRASLYYTKFINAAHDGSSIVSQADIDGAKARLMSIAPPAPPATQPAAGRR